MSVRNIETVGGVLQTLKIIFRKVKCDLVTESNEAFLTCISQAPHSHWNPSELLFIIAEKGSLSMSLSPPAHIISSQRSTPPGLAIVRTWESTTQGKTRQ